MTRERQPITVLGPFSETAAFVRQLVKQGLMTPEEGLRLTEISYHQTAVGVEIATKLLKVPAGAIGGFPEELPEYLKRFPGATNPDGTVRFSKSKQNSKAGISL